MGLEHVYWSLPIVIYPYISGLIAGSFIVGSLSKVFGLKKYEPLTRLSLLVTFAFILFAPVGPLADAKQPSRWWELFVRPHIPSAPMGLFTMIWTAYVILVIVELYIAFRVPNYQLTQVETGWKRKCYKFLTLGSTDMSEKRIHRDHTWLVILAGAGIFLAFSFHGYIGFIFGAIKARPLWHNALMMPMFITSAILSGIALMIILYSIVFRYFSHVKKIDTSIVSGLMKIMLWVILIDLFLDVVDLLNAVPSAYTDEATSTGFAQIFNGGPLTGTFWVGQIGLLILGLILACLPKVRKSPVWASISSLACLISIFFMRYNTVIGAQLQPKETQGLVSYVPPIFGVDSVQVVFGLFMFILFVFVVVMNVLPWDEEALQYRLSIGGEAMEKKQVDSSNSNVRA